MSVSLYRYTESCDGEYCCGDCDVCSKEERKIPRYIDADVLKEDVEYFFEYSLALIDSIEERIDKIPTADVKPVVRGKWQWLSSTYDRTPCEMRYWCDRCHSEIITHGQEPWQKFCPNCGADMRGDRNG